MRAAVVRELEVGAGAQQSAVRVRGDLREKVQRKGFGASKRRAGASREASALSALQRAVASAADFAADAAPVFPRQSQTRGHHGRACVCVFFSSLFFPCRRVLAKVDAAARKPCPPLASIPATVARSGSRPISGTCKVPLGRLVARKTRDGVAWRVPRDARDGRRRSRAAHARCTHSPVAGTRFMAPPPCLSRTNDLSLSFAFQRHHAARRARTARRPRGAPRPRTCRTATCIFDTFRARGPLFFAERAGALAARPRAGARARRNRTGARRSRSLHRAPGSKESRTFFWNKTQSK